MGLVQIGLPTGVATLAALLAWLKAAMRREGRSRLTLADRITLVRAVLTCLVAALVPHAPGDREAVAVLTALAAAALVLDGVDGRVARHTGNASRFGARFDMEVDALLVLVLSVHVARMLGAWVLLIGAARYVLLLATWAWPWLACDLPPRFWAKVVAVVQGVVLVTAGSGLLDVTTATVAVALALVLLAESFGRQVADLSRLHRRDDAVLPGLVRHG